MRLRLWRRRLTISAPRMAIRSAVPWPVRWLLGAVVLGLSGAVALWAFDVGRQVAGLDTHSVEEMAQLRDQVAQLERELQRAQAVANTAEASLITERTTQQALAAQLSDLQNDNRSLRRDLAFYEQLIPASGQDGLAVRGLQAQRRLATVHWQLLLVQSGRPTGELKAQLRTQYGLDRPLPVQLGVYLGKVLQGDLGYSYFFNLPVSQLILERLPATLLLVVTAVLASFLVGTAMGVLASRRPNGWLSQLITVLSMVGFAAPVFWTGMMLVILLAAVWPIFPISGLRSVDATATGIALLPDILHHLVLPALTLALVYLAQYSRLSRASMLDVLGSDFIRTARAKGLAEGIVLYKHALRNAVLPVITILGLQFGNVLAGAILVETVFNWPGLGRLAFESVLRRDYPTILGVLLFSSIVVVVMNQVTDLAYRVIDPRIKS